ncbi:N-acetyltransferase family protein [Rhodovibrionaceae bacterium A322]
MSASGSQSTAGAELVVRPVVADDYEKWLPLWDGYNEFYGRVGDTALPEDITRMTWQRFLDPAQPLEALVAEQDGELLGLAHLIYHYTTTEEPLSCYLNDLFTSKDARGGGVGRKLIEEMYRICRDKGITNVYWQTHETNKTAMRLYDQVAENCGFVIYETELSS